MGFIYKITNIVNRKSYIGLTYQTIEQRWKKHLQNADNIDYTLYRAMRKYGKDKFTIEQIEEVSDDILPVREQYWIEYYNTYLSGYNDTRGGEGNKKYNYDIFYHLWDEGCSCKEIQQILGCSQYTVTTVLKTCPTYSIPQSFQRRSESFKKAIIQFSLDGTIINRFNSIKDASKQTGINSSSISSCCNHREGFKTAGGYIWLWADEEADIDLYIDKLKQSRRSVSQMQKVEQLSLQNEHIAFFNTAKEAAQSFGKAKDSHIGDCCKGRRKTCFGYKWRYVND